jgi:nucleoside-diphosphate-sugar epimerase
MKYLITGGAGFIGAYVARLLVQEKKEVVIYDYDIDPRRKILEHIIGKEQIASVRMIRGDITDLAHLIRAAQEFHITKIVHLAALLSRASSENPSLAVRTNCDGTSNVFETARILHLEKVVYASSNTVFGTADMYEKEFISNDAPHYPLSVYGACKSFNERLAGYYFSEYGVDSVGLRFPAVYGVGHREGAASSILTEELMVKPAQGKPGKVPYRSDEIINWLHVEDAARGVVMASQKARTKTRGFNMGGEICSVATAVEYVKKLIPGADLTFLPKQIEFTGKFETTRIKEEIGYQPQWTLEKGIKQVIDEVRNR